ncbi:MAG: arylsulfatase [Bacteroidales bacterium]|nr:arylsulfatase [Bacteroidales bacterium]
MNKSIISYQYILLVLLAMVGVGNTVAKNKQPNIVFILTDDQGYGDLSINGNPHIETPNIDKLAGESVVFNRFMVSAVCAPTRASLLTGRYHLATGVNWVTRRKEVMNSREVTIAELLKDNGYRTGLFGKWHNGSQYPHNPVGQGFDEFVGFCAGHLNNYFDTKLENSQGEMIQTKGYITDVLTDYAIDFIEESKDEPFFCFVPYNAPHSPFQLPDSYFKKYKDKGLDDVTAAVYGMCENIDDNVERLIVKLKEEDLWENTIFIYSTDNGPNSYRYNADMKGKKAQVHEGGVRVPFYMRVPGKKPTEVNKLTAHIDILPTLAGLCNVKVPDGLDIHGKDVTPLINGKTKKWEERIIYTHNQPWVFEEGNAAAVRTETYRLVYTREGDTALYNMQKDPKQLQNILANEGETAEKFNLLYHNWFLDMTNGGKEPPCEPIHIGHEKAPLVTLPVVDARLRNKVKYSGKGWSNDWARNFRNKKGCIEWNVNVVEAGDYAILLNYSCSQAFIGFDIIVEANGQQIKKTLDKAFETKQIPSPDVVKRGEVYEYTWNEMNLGNLQLNKGQYKIRLRLAGDIKADNNFRVLDIKAKKKA